MSTNPSTIDLSTLPDGTVVETNYGYLNFKGRIDRDDCCDLFLKDDLDYRGRRAPRPLTPRSA